MKRKKNTMSFSAFCAQMGAPLKNVRNSWCSIDDGRRRALFTIWADELLGGRYVCWEHAGATYQRRPGATEMRRVIEQVMRHGYEALGVVCEAKDAGADPRVRDRFLEDKLLVLRFADEQEGLVAYVQGEVSAECAVVGPAVAIGPMRAAIDDLEAGPLGALTPARVGRFTQGYLRDDAVREFVIRRAQGRCEHCSKVEFLLNSGSPYLETHHIIGLAKQGPDTPDNVIALCASHHREAHYGCNAAELEAAFLEKLRSIAGRPAR